MVVINADQRDIIFEAVQAMYTDVATSPSQEFHFPTGRRATQFVGYPAAVLEALPERVVESFAGVGYPFAAGVIRPGDTVLDIGSGSGTDVMIASRLVGDDGAVLGLDMTEAMRQKLAASADALGATNVRVLAGDAENIPLPDASVDVVTSNGVLNLVPDKAAAVREIARVLRPGGRVQIADIVVASEPSAACRSQPQLWAECIVGATTQDEYLTHFRDAGFDDVEVLTHLDYFAGSESEETRKVAGSFGARTMVMRATLPAAAGGADGASAARGAGSAAAAPAPATSDAKAGSGAGAKTRSDAGAKAGPGAGAKAGGAGLLAGLAALLIAGCGADASDAAGNVEAAAVADVPGFEAAGGNDAATVADAAGVQAAGASHDDHIIYAPGDIAWQPGPGSFQPGAEFAVLEGDPGVDGFFNMRIRMPDGFVIAPHRHTGVERVAVLSGTFRLGMGDTFDRAAARPLPAGSYFSLPAGMTHYAVTEGETVIQLTSLGPWQIEYVDPADDPRR